MRPESSASVQGRLGFRDVLAIREFRAMFVAHLLSLVGDQVAKVALAILVFDRTSSATLAAATYALTYLPWLVGTPLLSGLGDRRRRRSVLVWCDVLRAGLVGLMVVPGLPIAVLLVLLGAVSLLAPPFESARAALLADVVEGDRYVLASAMTQMTLQGAQVAGFAGGGALVAVLKPRGALLLDAATFAASALFLVGGVARRPPPTGGGAGEAAGPGVLAGWLDGLRLVAREPVLRSLVLLAWVASFFSIAPEGLAVAIVRSGGGSSAEVGLLTAAGPLGAFLGALVIGRLVDPERRLGLLLPLALLSVAPMTLSATDPGSAGLFAFWVLAGLGAAYNLPAAAAFVQAVPTALRARAFGVAQAGLQIVQGLGLLAAGAAADHLAPVAVVALAGLCGSLGVLVLWLRWPREAWEQPATKAPQTGPIGHSL